MGKSRKWLQRFLFRFSEKHALHRLPVAVWMFSTKSEKLLAFEKVEAALNTIERYAPETLKVLRSDVRSILVAGDRSLLARYIPSLGMVEFNEQYVLRKQTTPEALACTLIHEAQHARLCRLGFGYEEPIRGRIERLCFRAERNFAERLPNGEKMVREAEDWMEKNLEPHFSIEGRRQAGLRALRENGAPAWLVRTMDWISRRRAN